MVAVVHEGYSSSAQAGSEFGGVELSLDTPTLALIKMELLRTVSCLSPVVSSSGGFPSPWSRVARESGAALFVREPLASLKQAINARVRIAVGGNHLFCVCPRLLSRRRRRRTGSLLTRCA